MCGLVCGRTFDNHSVNNCYLYRVKYRIRSALLREVTEGVGNRIFE